MPPKAKKEKFTDEQVQELCLQYLRDQNRPYNAQDVHLNHGQKFSKAQAQKALQALADRDEIMFRDLSADNKRSVLVYCAKQDKVSAIKTDLMEVSLDLSKEERSGGSRDSETDG